MIFCSIYLCFWGLIRLKTGKTRGTAKIQFSSHFFTWVKWWWRTASRKKKFNAEKIFIHCNLRAPTTTIYSSWELTNFCLIFSIDWLIFIENFDHFIIFFQDGRTKWRFSSSFFFFNLPEINFFFHKLFFFSRHFQTKQNKNKIRFGILFNKQFSFINF
jgi:hypothetical protein